MAKKGDMDYTLRMQKCQDQVEALEQEQKKIQVFQRELPLCLELVTQAIELCRKELSILTMSEHAHGKSECSERTTSDCAVFEEFLPIKLNPSSSDEHESCEVDKDGGSEKVLDKDGGGGKVPAENNGDKKKSDWLKSVQLWNQSPDPLPKKDQTKVVVEIKRNGGAFQPFQKEKPSKTDSQPVKAITPTPTTSSSTAETVGNKRESEKQSQLHRKQRRCWSPELHRRFLHALQQLGGSHVATPKQIRDLMKVDGLTNDEVKSHLQKYRLHTRRPATPAVTSGGENTQQPQIMVVEGIWVPSHDEANNRVYAPVAVQPPRCPPSEQRSSRRCKSPTTYPSTHTAHLLPLS